MKIYQHLAENPKCNLWLIHGYAESHNCFDSVFNTPLANEVNIFTVDLPSFGAEPSIEAGYETCINELAQKVKSTYPKLPVVILGHSMGGAVATCLANEINPTLLLVIDTSLFASATRITADVHDYPDAASFKQHFISKMTKAISSQPDIERLATQAKTANAEGLYYWAKEGIRMRDNNNVADLYAGFTFPKKYLIGDKSFTNTSNNPSIEPCKDSLVWLPDAGHWPMLDTPDAFWAKVRELIFS